MEVSVTTSAGTWPLSTQHYAPNVTQPDGYRFIESFTASPWPTWTFRLPDGTGITQEIHAVHGTGGTTLRWTLTDSNTRSAGVVLDVRLLLSGRDYHSLHHENPDFQFQANVRDNLVTWTPYSNLPSITVASNARYLEEPLWFRQFYYARESERGLDCMEDLAAPGVLRFDLSSAPASCLLIAGNPDSTQTASKGSPLLPDPAPHSADLTSDRERIRRKRFAAPLHRSADAYLVQRGSGLTIVAGYPWFTDWGRDTFIALRGLCLATGRLNDARQILTAWAETVSEGMLPNRFPDHGDHPEFNSVDASLWFVIAVHDFLQACNTSGSPAPADVQASLRDAVESILIGYGRGTRYGIGVDEDGLIRAGQPGVQLTWMDAKVGDWVVTPRIGKPVEIQALWINSLWIASQWSACWQPMLQQSLAAFQSRFWNESTGCLFDIVDVNHKSGHSDASIRPNQIFAAGGLPLPLLDASRCRRVVDVVEQKLLAPYGLRTLDPASPDYRPHCTGGIHERDGAYHQGTVWPWLMGPFVEAWLRTHGYTEEARKEARERFVQPLLEHLNDAGIGHISEITDGDSPHTPRGCPFQAWSLGEVLRVLALVNLPGES